MNHRPFAVASMILLVLAAGFLIARKQSYSKQHRAVQKPSAQQTSVPSIGGQITEIKPSPDHTVVALLISNAKQDRDDYVILFDPAEKLILARIPECHSLDDLTWMADSSQAAIQTSERTAMIVDRKGTRTAIKDYVSPDERADQIVAKKDKLFAGSVGHFAVNGQDYVAYYHYRADRVGSEIQPNVVYVMNLTTGHMTTYKDNSGIGWDWYKLRLSPDGKYFCLIRGLSGGEQWIISKTREFDSVVHGTTHALALLDDPDVPVDVVWPDKMSYKTEYLYKQQYAIVEANPPFLLGLETGTRRLFNRCKALAWLKDDYVLVVTDEGLVQAQAQLFPFGEQKLLLRHKINPLAAETERATE